MSDWVAICESEGAQPVEIETEEDGSLPLGSVSAHFPGATTLKYRAPGGTAYRGVKMKEEVLFPPTGGWAAAPLYIAVNPTAEATKRKREEEGAASQSYTSPAKAARPMYDEDDAECRDMILLGMKPSTTEAEVREYFKDKADVQFCQMKKSKDGQTGYAFVKFGEKEKEKSLRRQKHTIDGRECTLKIPDSRQGPAEKVGNRKVYVSYHDESLTKDEMRQHFEQFGEVEDMFVPSPWRHFAFVTFSSAQVAQSLIGKEHNVRGVSLLMKNSQAPRGKGEERAPEGGEGGGAHGDWGAWGRGAYPPAPGMDQWQLYAKMMQESMYGGRGAGGPPLPPGPSGGRGASGGYGPAWPSQEGWGGYGKEEGGYGPPAAKKY